LNNNQNTNVNEPKSEPKIKPTVWEPGYATSDTPLFLRDGSEADQGNAQDEKDKTEE
jgi:hypothetical protein